MEKGDGNRSWKSNFSPIIEMLKYRESVEKFNILLKRQQTHGL
jgi:hypothetical protein